MLIGQEHTTLFIGNFGSGKTEAAVNFAIMLKRQGLKDAVTLVDLDLVNPYFRSREPREYFEKYGVRLVIPDSQYMYADLPILVPEVRSLLVASTSYVILDVGGDDVGARVLGALHDALPPGSYRALMVLNASRPFTNNVEGIIKIKGEIEASGKISITGFVSNTHLMDDTTLDTILRGYRLAKDTEARTGLPLEFVCVPERLAADVKEAVSEDVLPIFRYLAPEWAERESRGGEISGKDLFKL
jgi:hypothetical protein